MGIAPDSIMGVTVQTVTDQMEEITISAHRPSVGIGGPCVSTALSVD